MHEAVVVEIVRTGGGWEVRSEAQPTGAWHEDLGLALDAATLLAGDRPVQIRVRETAGPAATRNLMGNLA